METVRVLYHYAIRFLSSYMNWHGNSPCSTLHFRKVWNLTRLIYNNNQILIYFFYELLNLKFLNTRQRKPNINTIRLLYVMLVNTSNVEWRNSTSRSVLLVRGLIKYSNYIDISADRGNISSDTTSIRPKLKKIKHLVLTWRDLNPRLLVK